MRSPLRLRLFLVIMSLVLVILVAFGVTVHEYFSGVMVGFLGEEAQVVAVALSRIIESRMPEYREILTEADQKRPFYRETKELFRKMKSEDFIKFIYTERRISDGEIAYFLDSEPLESEDSSPVGSRDAMNALRERAYSERIPIHGPLTDDPEWGMFITGYAPLFDPESGAFEGLVGVDIKGDTVFAALGRIRLILIFIASVLVLASALLVLRFSDTIARQVSIDPLTGAYAKKHLLPDLARAIRVVAAGRKDTVLIMLDLDRFKDVNDTYGHEAGDRLLRGLGDELRGSIRTEDRLYRFGGDEFAVIMPEATREQTLDIAERLRIRVEGYSVEIGEHKQVSVTASVGVARWKPGLSPDDLIRKADDAMYAAKRSGKNNVTESEVFRPE